MRPIFANGVDWMDVTGHHWYYLRVTWLKPSHLDLILAGNLNNHFNSWFRWQREDSQLSWDVRSSFLGRGDWLGPKFQTPKSAHHRSLGRRPTLQITWANPQSTQDYLCNPPPWTPICQPVGDVAARKSRTPWIASSLLGRTCGCPSAACSPGQDKH